MVLPKDLLQTFNGEPVPLMDGQAPDTFPGSPLAIIAVFTEVVRARFSGQNEEGLPWVWHPDPTPLPGETNSPDAPRTLYIEAGYTEAADARNFRPAILVDKDETQTLKLWIGNRASIHVPSRKQLYVAHVQVPITVTCLSNRRGESANLGDHVFMHLLACRDLIRETFNIHDITNPILGKTLPQRRSGNENETWVTAVSVTCQYKFMWQTTPIAPLLQDIAMKISTAGGGDFDKGALEIVERGYRAR